MEGIVEVFQIKDGCWDKTYEESNMVVHSGKVACADIFTHVPYEASDGTTPDASSVYQSVSNYTIQSITLGAGTKTMAGRDARHLLTKDNDKWGSNTTEYLDVSGKFYSLLPYRENWNFSSFGSFGLHKTPVKPKKLPHPGKTPPRPLLLDANILKHGFVKVATTDEDGGSIVIKKRKGQDFAILEVPLDLHLHTKYKLSLGVEGDLPVKMEVVRVDKINRENSLSVDLREQVWDFDRSRFVYEHEESNLDNLSKLLYASSVIPGELTETLLTTAFDRIDEGKRVELFDYKVRITAPKATDFEKGEVRLYDLRLESLDDTLLKNPNFNKVESLVTNTSFKDLTPYSTLSEEMPANTDELKVMGVYQIGGWEHQSPLYTSANPLWESLQSSCLLGWISLDNVDSYGTSAKPPRVLDGDESNIGVCFNSCALAFDWSGTAQLTKKFKFPNPWTDYYTQTGSRFEKGFLNDPYSHRSLVVKFDACPVSSTDTNPNEMMGVKIRCKNVTKNLSYNFVSGSSMVAKTWGVSGNPAHLGQGLSMDTSTTLQTNINMPLDFYNDEFKLDIIGHAGNANGVRGKLILKNLDIGQVQGWHVHEATASGVTVSSCTGFPTSGINILTDQSQNPPADWYSLSSIEKQTFLSQTITGLNPSKVYNLLVEGKSNVGTGTLGVALVHKGFSNPYHFDYAKYLTVGPYYNAGNAYFQWFNPDTTYNAAAFTMPGPQGPPTNSQADADFEEHQKCVRWRLNSPGLAVGGSPLYKFVDTDVSSFNLNNTYASLPPGKFKFETDLRHFCDTTLPEPWGYYVPVCLGLRVKSAAYGQAGQGERAYWYNFKTRKFERTTDDIGYNNNDNYKTTLLPGSHARPFAGSVHYPKIAKSTQEVELLGGDPKGWTSAQVSFDVRDEDFVSDAPMGAKKKEAHVAHSNWGTRDVEFIFYADDEMPPPEGNPEHGNFNALQDPSGTFYIKNTKIKGPSPYREPLNTYYMYRGNGDWVATSSLSSVEVYGDPNSGPRAGHRPLRDVSSGINTWNELGTDFAQTINLNGEQQVLPIYGMDKLRPPDSWGVGYGNGFLQNTGSTMASSMRTACEDSVYDLLLFHAGGSDVEVHNVTLTDAATQFNDGVDVNKTTRWTSEAEGTNPRVSFPGGWSTQFVNTANTDTHSGRTEHPAKVSIFVSGGQDDAPRVRVGAQDGTYAPTYGKYHNTIVSYCDTLENFGMEHKRKYSLSFDYLNTAATLKEAIFIDIGHSDKILFLSGTGENTQWVPTNKNRLNYQTNTTCWRSIDNFYNAGGTLEHVYDLTTNYLSPEFTLPEGLKLDAKIGIFVKTSPTSTSMTTVLGDMRGYRVVSPDDITQLIPMFSNEQDCDVQVVTDASSPGEYGHFQNAMEFVPSATATTQLYNASTTEHIPSFEKAIHRGTYLPGSEVTFSAGTFGFDGNHATNWNTTTSSVYGVLNRYSVITPRGHILRNYNEGSVSWLHDSSGGLAVSGPFDTATDNRRVVKYALTLTKAEYAYLNYYGGGIETAGLWAIDGPGSAKKQDYNYARPPYLMATTGTPYTESIYNLKDYIEPKWKLFAKKVFFAGGLKMHEDSDYLTIIWSLKF